MHKIFNKIKEEFFAILPPTIFFFVALHILTIIRVLIARGSHFGPLSTVSIAIAGPHPGVLHSRELVRVVAKEKKQRLFFGPMPLPAF
jgi:hypothetical protein